MRSIRIFKFKLKFDSGIINITTSGSSVKSAKQKILQSEGCPESAIISISIHPNQFRHEDLRP